MRRPLIVLATLLSLLSPSAQAANSTVSAMTAASALGGTELLYCVQSAADRKCTPVQLSAYIFGLVSGDLTCTGLGACTLKNTGPGAIGPLGSTTTTPVVTIDAQGRVTALTSASIAFPAAPAGANPTATAGPTAVNGAATTFLRSDGAPAVQLGTAAQKGIVQVDGTSIAATSGVINVNPGCGLINNGTTLAGDSTARNTTLTTDTIVTGDCGRIVTENNASAVAVAIAQAGTTGFATGYYTTVKNKGVGTATITPTTSTIDGAASLACKTGQSVDLLSDGTNYITLNNTCGQAQTIANGTSALGTGAITSATCTTVVTTSATGTATTDVVWWGFNGDPTAVTGYVPLTSGMLTIISYPTSNNVNFKVCNNTTASITPGAITLNWRIVR